MKQQQADELNDALDDISLRKQRRRRVRMQKRDAKGHVDKLSTYELVIKGFSAVDMVTFLLQHFRGQPNLTSNLAPMRKHLQAYLSELKVRWWTD